jgi:hypothetical protein
MQITSGSLQEEALKTRCDENTKFELINHIRQWALRWVEKFSIGKRGNVFVDQKLKLKSGAQFTLVGALGFSAGRNAYV